jgi:RNA 2',3'-cyclic 3'-phosphodiesterase
MKRLFIAIKIKPDSIFLEQFRELKEALKHDSIKWVEEHNIHITLKFLGETDESRIPAIGRALDRVARETKVFRFSLEGLGIFGSKYDPRVIWTAIKPYEVLARLMEKVHQALEAEGFERDRQNLVPHLTLGRIKSLKDKKLFHEVIGEFSDIASEPITAAGMILFESILKKEGPEYRMIQAHSFQFAMSNEQ